MSITVSPGLTSVTGNVNSVPSTTPLGVVVGVEGSATGAGGTTDIATVPANRRWRVLTAWLAVETGQASPNWGFLKLGGVIFLSSRVNAFGAAAGDSGNASGTWDYSAGPVLTAGQTVNITNSNVAAAVTRGGISYIEEVV